MSNTLNNVDITRNETAGVSILKKFYSSLITHYSLLFLMALLVRLVYALQITFPPLDDPAYYIQAARALNGPRPLDFEVGIIWNFQPFFATVQHPGMEFWMPLSSFAIWFSTKILGDNFFAAQLPSIIAGALLPLFAYAFARRFTPPGLSFISALLVALNPLLVYQSALPDSSMLYAALVCAALLLLPRLLERTGKPKVWRALSFGLLTGLAYLARTPAVFLALTYFGFWILNFGFWILNFEFWIYLFKLRGAGAESSKGSDSKSQNLNNHEELIVNSQSPVPEGVSIVNSPKPIINHQSLIVNPLWVLLGLALPVGLWSSRNLMLFGFISSPAGTQTIFLFDYQDLFNYKTPINFQTWLAAGPGKIIGIRLEALGSAWSVLDKLSPPTVVIGAVGLALLTKREKTARPVAWYSLLLFLGVPLIFAVASLNGSYYHSAGSSAPFLAVGQVYLLWQGWLWWQKRRRGSRSVRPRPSPVLAIVLTLLILLNAGLLLLNLGPVSAVHRQDADLYGRVKAWLNANPAPVVITNQPATLNYVSNQASVRLPANEDLATLQEVAHKYGAKYIILTEQSGRYPALLDSPDNKLFPLVHQGGDFEVFAVVS
jgi:4-amino-4-deoxy-L-arabinose transferase-like glycosyltransferase